MKPGIETFSRQGSWGGLEPGAPWGQTWELFNCSVRNHGLPRYQVPGTVPGDGVTMWSATRDHHGSFGWWRQTARLASYSEKCVGREGRPAFVSVSHARARQTRAVISCHQHTVSGCWIPVLFPSNASLSSACCCPISRNTYFCHIRNTVFFPSSGFFSRMSDGNTF